MLIAFKNRLFTSATAFVVAVAMTGCTFHDVVVNENLQGMKLTDNSNVMTVGHINSNTWGLSLVVFPFLPGPDEAGNLSNSVAYTYGKMAEEAQSHGANVLLDVSSTKTASPFMFIVPFIRLHSVTISANMGKMR